MMSLNRVMRAVPLAGALVLASCGGGDSATPTPAQQASQGIAVGEPNGGAPVVSEFVKLAQGQSCTDFHNRLYVIDGKQVFWDRAGNCPDMGYSQTLYGYAPEQLLCQRADSIAGPRTFCADDKSRALFDIILQNLDKPDLGLAGHKVEQVAMLPAAGTAIAFETVASSLHSAITQSRTSVVKDAAALNALWAEHAKFQVPAPDAPKVDFSHQMVLAVFGGGLPNPCHSMGINRVASTGDKIVVEYAEYDMTPVRICTQMVIEPMQLVVVERSDAPVEFVKTKAVSQGFATIGQSTRSGVSEPRNVVVKDAAAWAALWAQHAGPQADVPPVDFASQMVAGVFLGKQPNGCYGTTIQRVSLAANKLTVLHADSVPGMGVMCTLQITTPAHLVVVDRTDAEPVFGKELMQLK
jgi:hypothetical protein